MNEFCYKSKFWIGMGLGAVVGAVACHLAHTDQAKEMRIKMNEAIQRTGDKVQTVWQTAKEKIASANDQCCKDCGGE